MPERIRLSRKAGWRKPDGAINVARPTRWGNPYKPVRFADGWHVAGRAIKDGSRHGRVFWLPLTGHCFATYEEALADSIDLYRLVIVRNAEDEYGDHDDPVGFALSELRGHDLGCWCPLSDPCHADVLLELANACRPDPEDGD
jgi:hypothetical protein